jgi:hypothetical protein
MKHSNCPKCSGEFVKRVSRHGVLERLLSLFYVFPFRCQLCGHRFKLWQWGEVYHKTYFEGFEFEPLPVSLSVALWKESGEQGPGTLRDLSMRGCGITSGVALAQGNILRLELHIPEEPRAIVVQAAVVRTVTENHSQVEFLQLNSHERERLRALVRSESASRKSLTTAPELLP